MKRKTLTTAVLAGIGGVAGIANISGAVNLNPDGLGQVLIYPYYTVNGGNDTLVSVVNTTDAVKAVKVRFLESKNSREVRDFNLYLSPFDVWVAAVTSTGDTGAAVLVVPDGEDTCTVPQFDTVPFTNLILDETTPGGAFVDNTIERTREGYIEMIEMGVVDESADAQVTGFEDAAIHLESTGEPFNCDLLSAAWTRPGGTWIQDDDIDVIAPTGGLFGGASIINVFGGYMVSYNAEAIDGFYNPMNGGAGVTAATRNTLHSEPRDTFPSLLEANTQNLTGSEDIVRSFVFDNGNVVTSDWNREQTAGGVDIAVPDAVSAIFMRDFIYNEYAIESALGGATEWVLTFPTKRFYVDPAIPGTDAIRPFTNQFGADGLGACEFVALSFFDREEDTVGITGEAPIFSPFEPTQPPVPFLCFEAQVVSFGQEDSGLFGTVPSEIFGSPNSQNIAVETEEFESGWARIGFGPAEVDLGLGTAHTMTSTATVGDPVAEIYNGLPVTGFAAQIVRNGTLDDGAGGSVLSNYAGLFNHRSNRDITAS